MSRLDDILGGTNYSKVSWSSRQVNDMGLSRQDVKDTKQEIIDLVLDILDNPDLWVGVNPSTNIAKEMRKL